MLVYSCNDLIFSTKIRVTAEAMLIESRPARSVEQLRARLDREDDGKCCDAVGCVMVDLELGEFAFEMIKFGAGHEATPYVIAFGPHVMVGALAGAERVGADAVMARGAFTGRLSELIARYGG